jgi:hypothetical protein
MTLEIMTWFGDDLCASETTISDSGDKVGELEDVMPWDVDHATAVVPDAVAYMRDHSASELPDVISCSGLDMLVSLRVKMLMEDLRLGEEVGFLPTTVLSRRKKRIADYYYLYSRDDSRDNAVDLRRSAAQYVEGTNIVIKVRKWVFDPSRLPDADLFRCHRDWIATETLKDRFESHGIRGFRFIPIWSHENGALCQD